MKAAIYSRYALLLARIGSGLVRPGENQAGGGFRRRGRGGWEKKK